MSEQSITLKLGFIKKQECDTISDSLMEEIVRRITVSGAIGPGLAIPFYGSTPPEDKSRPWIVANSAGVLTGKVKIWNSATASWEEDESSKADAPREMVTQKKTLTISGNGTVIAEWDDEFEDDSYQVAVVATSGQGAAKFHQSSVSSVAVQVTVTDYATSFTIEVSATGYLKEDS